MAYSMTNGNDENGRESTTFTYNEKTREFLERAYPDAISVNEALRSAISDARLVRESDISIEDGNDD